jgi:hypothetical protein
MNFARSMSLFDAPFPSDDLLTSDGHIDVSKMPTNGVDLITQAVQLIGQDARGFARAGATYFSFSDAIDPTTLPDVQGSTGGNPTVFVMLVDPNVTQPSDLPVHHPVDVSFQADGGPFGAPNMLAVLPMQGAPLLPSARYAVVVTREVKDIHGAKLPQSPTVANLRSGGNAGLQATVASKYTDAIGKIGISPDDIAAISVFTTDDPTTQLDHVLVDARTNHPLAKPAAPTIGETFTDYCVFNSTISIPTYQSGTPPYSSTGGGWTFDASGNPIYDHSENARIVFTVPRKTAPGTGWPTVIFVRTGGGGDRPLVDRGVCATAEFTTPITPGSGPAQEFAQIGWAGVQIDGVLGGIRNPTTTNEDYLIFNVLNAAALRDNVRQSAVELALLANLLPSLTFDTSACPGAPATFTVDASNLAIMGHSMGGWIAPITVAAEPTLKAGVFSGAGGSYINNILDKQKPIPVRPLAESIIGYAATQRTLTLQDPALTMLQWAAEPSDPQVYDRNIRPSQQILMLQGIVDHYIMPSIANATSLAMRLDQAGPGYDATNAELMMDGQRALAPLLPLVGRAAISLPAAGNQNGRTAVVVQHPGDTIEDGHEVVFQTEPPKHQYRCFLSSLPTGVPLVPPDGAISDPCQ